MNPRKIDALLARVRGEAAIAEAGEAKTIEVDCATFLAAISQTRTSMIAQAMLAADQALDAENAPMHLRAAVRQRLGELL